MIGGIRAMLRLLPPRAVSLGVAPFFIDAECSSPTLSCTRPGGLTVISFLNNHLVYAFTWFGLGASMLIGALYHSPPATSGDLPARTNSRGGLRSVSALVLCRFQAENGGHSPGRD